MIVCTGADSIGSFTPYAFGWLYHIACQLCTSVLILTVRMYQPTKTATSNVLHVLLAAVWHDEIQTFVSFFVIVTLSIAKP
jgi:hypothetical protein